VQLKFEEDESLTLRYLVEIYLSTLGLIFGPGMVILIVTGVPNLTEFTFLFLATISFAIIPFVSIYSLYYWPIRVKMSETEIKYSSFFRNWDIKWEHIETYQEKLDGKNVTITFIHKYTQDTLVVPAIRLDLYPSVIDYVRAHVPESTE